MQERVWGPGLDPVRHPHGSGPLLGAGRASVPSSAAGDLQARLDDAVRAAHDAYRDSARPIRLLPVSGQPSSPEELVDTTLTVLSEAFEADIVCLVGSDPDTARMRVLGSCGLPEDDPALTEGRPIRPAGTPVRRTGRATWARLEDGSPNTPSCLSELGVRSAAWVPPARTPPTGCSRCTAAAGTPPTGRTWRSSARSPTACTSPRGPGPGNRPRTAGPGRAPAVADPGRRGPPEGGDGAPGRAHGSQDGRRPRRRGGRAGAARARGPVPRRRSG